MYFDKHRVHLLILFVFLYFMYNRRAWSFYFGTRYWPNISGQQQIRIIATLGASQIRSPIFLSLPLFES
uniref:Putative ovule protein n=1 Tax=Solanum chacoense TaxID=4108 RepID=A0A0V0INH9_SOLCH